MAPYSGKCKLLIAALAVTATLACVAFANSQKFTHFYQTKLHPSINGQLFVSFANNELHVSMDAKSTAKLSIKFGHQATEVKSTMFDEKSIFAEFPEANLSIKVISNEKFNEYKIVWSSHYLLYVQHNISLKNGHWYGGAEQTNQRWPMENMSSPMKPYIGSSFYQAAQERYWLCSERLAIIVPDEIPLWVEQSNRALMLRAQYDQSVYANFVNVSQTNPILAYSIVTPKPGHHMTLKDLHFFVLNEFYGKPSGLPDLRMMRYPVWSTWVSFGRALTHNKTIELAKNISAHGFNNSQLEIDDGWETGYGDLIPNPAKYPNFTDTVATLSKMGFRTTLWVHHFAGSCSGTGHSYDNYKYFVKPCQHEPFYSGWMKNHPTYIPWWNGVAASVDVTNPTAAHWWTTRLKNLTKEHGVHSFKFDAGEAMWIGTCYSLHNASFPNQFGRAYAENAAKLGNGIEVRVTSRTQHLPVFVRVLDRSSDWSFKNGGLKALITTSLLFGVLGYPFVLPDMVGGNGSPDEELFIRWVQVCTFMPSIQFSILPWQYGERATNITRNMMQLRDKWFEYIHVVAQESVKTGAPIMRPTWWLEESEEAFRAETQFLIGDKLLVAPIVYKGMTNRLVYLPKAKWFSHIDSKVHVGPMTIVQNVSLEQLAYYSAL